MFSAANPYVSGGAMRPMRGGRRQSRMRVPVAKGKGGQPDLSKHPWFWHPDRPQFTKPSIELVVKLEAVHPDFGVSWNPNVERWQLWARDRKVTHPVCSGWKLVAVCEWDGQYVALDERVLALAYSRCSRYAGHGNEYWQRIEAELARDKAAASRAHQNEIEAGAKDYWDHTRIQVSMCGPSSGSKFASCHSE
jgi:hypothetical protein